MNKFDEMNAEEIREYLTKNKCSWEKARDIYNHEMNGEMRPKELEAIRDYMVMLKTSKKKAKEKSKAKVEKKG